MRSKVVPWFSVLALVSVSCTSAAPTPVASTAPPVASTPTPKPAATATPSAAPTPSSAPTPSPSPAPTLNPAAAYADLPGWIAFEHFGKTPDGKSTSFNFDDRRIWLVHPDGSGLHELAPGKPVDGKASPDVSPDGTTVVFSTWDPLVRVWTAPIAGGDPTLLSKDCSGVSYECQAMDPSFSADGTKVAWVQYNGGRRETTIAILNRATGSVTELPKTAVSSAQGHVGQPSWSPDGREIVYHRVLISPAAAYPTDARLFVAETDGSAVRELPQPTGAWAGDPDWSPDGSLIVFSSVPERETEGWGEAPKGGIYTIRPDGTDLRALCVGDDCLAGGSAPSWTPDGRILFWGFRSWALMNRDGSGMAHINQPKLTWFGDQLGYGYAAVLAPKPTAGPTPTPTPVPTTASDDLVRPGEEWVAFEWVAKGADAAGIRLIRPDGSGDHWGEPNAPIGGGHDIGEGWQLAPDWSPDGSQLAFGVDIVADGTRDVWISDADGTDARLVYDCVAPCGATNDPSWTHDGKSVIFVAWDHVNNAVDGSRLLKLDVSTGTVRTLATTTGSDYFQYPRLSPDDKRAVVEIDHWSSIDDSSTLVSTRLAIVDLSVTPGRVISITDPAAMANYPDWHPTENRIVFTMPSSPGSKTEADLYTMRPDGSDQRLLLHVDGRRLEEPSWLPDGSGVIFVSVGEEGYQAPGMATVKADGSGFAWLTGDEVLGSHPRMRPLP